MATYNGPIGTKDDDWTRPDKPSRCTYAPGMPLAKSPHHHSAKSNERPKIYPDITHFIHNTPVVRLNKIPQAEGVNCQMFAKCEFFNPGGSTKDRIAIRMIEDAEKSGRLKPGYTIIEPTSGNTGLGLALVAAVKGYKCIIVLPEKMSKEKVDVLKALGADIVRTPNSASFDHPDSNIRVADRMARELPNAVVLNQYINPGNPLAHYDHTAEEILDDFDGHVDMVVCSAGTGGTITGIARKIKEKCPKCMVIGVDPLGSILASPPELNVSDRTFYEVEGIGYDFLPTVFERKYIDKWYKSDDKPSFTMARRLIKEEGLLCGGSSGSAMYCAIQAAKDFNLGADQKVVVLLPDSIRNYMTKFLSDDWLKMRSLYEGPEKVKEQKWRSEKIPALNYLDPTLLGPDTKVSQAVEVLKQQRQEFAVVCSDEDVLGTVDDKRLLDAVMAGSKDDPISTLINKQYKKLNTNDTLASLSSLLETERNVLIVEDSKGKHGSVGKTVKSPPRSKPKKPASLLGFVSSTQLAVYLAGRSSK